jgi:C-terminal processing protease CtpA/Prc
MSASSPRNRWIHACGLGVGIIVGIVASDTWGQASDKDQTKETAKEAREEAHSATKEARKETRDARDEARDTTREVRGTARDTKQAGREAGREAGQEARKETREARENTRNTREEGRDEIRDTRDKVRDARSGKRDERRDARASFRAEDVRSADIGLWFDRSAKDNLTISDVGTRGAIAKLGFREGDRIISVNGQKVTNEKAFIRDLFARDVRNDQVDVVVMRGGREQTIQVKPSVLIEDYTYVDNDPLEHFGVVLDDRYTDKLVVWKVLPRSPAFYAGIRPGDIIVTFNGQKAPSIKEFTHLVQTADPGNVRVDVSRDSKIRQFDVDVPQFEARSQRQTLLRPNLDGNASERRDERQDRREERRDERQDRREERRDDGRPRLLPGNNSKPAAPRP